MKVLYCFMKKNIVVLALVIMPMAGQAQIKTVTYTQKQQALQTVSRFCSLLTDWSNGQRTLDTQIYNLCSGNDCSAYDDVSTKKETTMRNYLLGIQKKYPKSLSMQITQPTLSNCEISYEPELSLMSHVGSITNDMNPFATQELIELTANSYKNAYMVFKVRQTIPNLSIISNRLIVYDLKAQKITAYVTGKGTFINYIEGLNLMVKRDYKNAILKFDAAAVNPRGSLKRFCNNYSYMCSAYLNDITSMIRYGKATNIPVISKHCDLMKHYVEESYRECLTDMKECERLIKQNSEYEGMLPGLYGLIGFIYGLPDEMTHIRNIEKSIEYFRKAIKAGNMWSAFMFFQKWLHDDDYDDYVSGDEMMGNLKLAADKGHTGAILLEGKMTEISLKDVNGALKWYEKGAKLGDTFCMACLGKLLIEKGGNKVSEGRRWLQKSLDGDAFDRQLNAYKDLINDEFWPKSKMEIQNLLNNTPVTPISPSSNNTSTNSGNQSSLYYPSSTYSSYRIHRPKPFNHKQDSYWGGISVGYIQKQWIFEQDGEKEKMGLFDDDKYLQGIQAGIRVDPQFGWGFGMNTGLFYEYCWAKSGDLNDVYGSYRLNYNEHGLYIPLDLKYTMNFSKWFQLSFYGGLGFNYVISGRIKVDDDNYNFDEDIFSDNDNMKRLNMMLEYGISLRMKALQLDFMMSQGLNNWSDESNVTVKQGRLMSVSASFCF